MLRPIPIVLVAVAAAATAFVIDEAPHAQARAPVAIVLGVGTPVTDAERSGTSIGVIGGDTLYLFDAGAGVERRIMEAKPQLEQLGVKRIGPIFITHLHMDHTLGLAALSWYHSFHPASGRLTFGGPMVPVFGPPGIRDLMNHVSSAFQNPVDIPTHELDGRGGEVYADASIAVRAFPVVHKDTGPWFAYRIQAAGKSIVISGDTRPTDTIVDACKGCDILFHEVNLPVFGPDGPIGNAAGHTSGAELGLIAKRASPKQLVLYHYPATSGAAADAIAEIRKSFNGPVARARDLDVFYP